MYQYNRCVMPSPAQPAFGPASTRFRSTMSLTARVSATVGHWVARQRSRRALTKLDDRLLDDVGLSRTERSRETAKTFWTP